MCTLHIYWRSGNLANMETAMNHVHRTAAIGATLLLAALAAQAQTPSSKGRLLASNCFQCHGTNGRGPGFDKLAGKAASEIYEEMKSFQTGHEGNGIMARHAMGYTDAQLRDLSNYLSRQR
jgi:cytochrome subunit of sulfide dehydrogenase